MRSNEQVREYTIADLSIKILDIVNASPSMTLNDESRTLEVISRDLLKLKLIDLFETLS